MTTVQEDMIDELLNSEEGLSAWEIDFIEDLDRLRGRELTVRQADKLEDIWQRIHR